MTLPQLRKAARELEQKQDIPTSTRLMWLQQAKMSHNEPRQQLILQQTIKGVQVAGKKPKYDTFYDVGKLLDMAFSKDSTVKMAQVDRLILQLRITTMMRSIEIANMVWAIYELDNKYFVRTTNKQGQIVTYSVKGQTLTNLLDYMYQHIKVPAPLMFRYVN